MTRSNPDLEHDSPSSPPVSGDEAGSPFAGCFEGAGWPLLCLDTAARILESNRAAQRHLLGETPAATTRGQAWPSSASSTDPRDHPLTGRALTTLASPDGECVTADWWQKLTAGWLRSAEVRPITLVAGRERFEETPARTWFARRVELADLPDTAPDTERHIFCLVACPVETLPLARQERALFERAPVAVQITDARGGLVAVNARWRRLLGYTGDDAGLSGRSWRRLLITDDDAWTRLQAALRTGAALDGVRLRMRRRDDQSVTVRVSTRPLAGGMTAVFLEDISALEAIEARRRAAAEHIDANDRARTAFFAAVSHELRTPLNAILGYSQLMARRGGLSSEHERAISAIRRCGQQLLSLVDEVLDRAHIAGLRERPATGAHPAVIDPAAALAHQDDAGGRRTGYEGRRRRVLLVDDRAENRAVLGDVLSPLGFEILEVDSGLGAVEAVANETPDLVLMDLVMPGIDGIEATRRIRLLPGVGDAVRIVAVTASIFEADRRGSQQAGCDAFVSKPIDVNELLDRLGEQLNLVWTGPEPSSPTHASPDGTEALATEALEALEALREAAAEGRIVDARLALAELELALREAPWSASWGAMLDQLSEMVAEFRLSQVCTTIDAAVAVPGGERE